jgi:phage-related protein
MVLNLIMGIAKALPQLIVTGLNTLTKFVQGLGQGNPALVSKALDIVKTLALGLINAAPQILAAGVQLIFALIQGITRQFAVIPGKVASLARKIPSAIKSGVGNLAGIGRNLIEGLWGGIKSKFDSVVARVKALAAKLPKAVKKVLGIGSPSRVMNRQVGRWIPAGLAQGITQNTRLVTDAMQNLVSIPNSAMGYAMASEYEYGVSARYEVIVPVELNGREIARATASDMQTALNQREMRANRKVGVR